MPLVATASASSHAVEERPSALMPLCHHRQLRSASQWCASASARSRVGAVRSQYGGVSGCQKVGVGERS